MGLDLLEEEDHFSKLFERAKNDDIEAIMGLLSSYAKDRGYN